MKPLVCEMNEKNGYIESKCCEEGEAREQPAQSSGGDSGKTLTRRGLHDQLISGKVPPIIQNSALLSPGGAGSAGLSVADSMDNLAALIPR